ncbi:VOC family protein [Aeromicrobium sp. NPDC092404]|uniref:VOC family protein n=1 Tax=Aeromicrobium sp. NPDC092404 TaxID=3154976 RepID=UPI0034311080
MTSSSTKDGLNRVHLHLTSTDQAEMDGTITRALELGGSHLDVGQLPEEGHVVLSDPEGNELCVIPPGSTFLAGCGFLGELACEGSREVGLFWSAALDWPLVWDQDGETAVQSPRGGTKIAWGGPPVAPKRGRNRQRLDLVSYGDIKAEVDRLVALGASLGGDADGAVELTDPDGNEFRLLSG